MVLGFRPRVFVVLLISVSLLGCQKKTEITSYDAPKDVVHIPRSEQVDSTNAKPVRQGMLGAILPAGDSLWFLKLTGDPDAIKKVRDAFQPFALSVDLSEGAPKWNLPEEWEEKPGNAMRYKTIMVPVEAKNPDGKKLELSVISLPARGELNKDLLDNVNRWRGQLGLPPVNDGALMSVIHKVDREGQSPVYLCEFEGTSAGGMGTPPFASGAPFANSSQAAGPERSGTDSTGSGGAGGVTDIRVQAPSEWKPGRLSQMRRAAYVVSDGDQQAEITVISALGDELANVNRWRGQVGLPEISAEQMAKEKRTLEVAGEPASYFVIQGAADSPQSQSMLVSIVPHAGTLWFVKMMGDTQLVMREQQRFEQFVRDIQFQ